MEQRAQQLLDNVRTATARAVRRRLLGTSSNETSTARDSSRIVSRETCQVSLPEPELLVGLSAAKRLQMELVARSFDSSDDALEPILQLLIEGSPQKLCAIATAFRENQPLREQWERTWEVLHGIHPR